MSGTASNMALNLAPFGRWDAAKAAPLTLNVRQQMSSRELIGLVLSIAAIAIAPFGYWLSAGWLVVALVLGLPGLVLFFTARNSRKYDPAVGPDADVVPASSELRGFHGSRALDSFPDTYDGD
jgi:hypothetical protein